jgi:amino acid transporter
MATHSELNEKTGNELGVTRDSSNEAVPAYGSKVTQSELSFWTRMGCTTESFKRRTISDQDNQLNQTLKKRHLHMIAVR